MQNMCTYLQQRWLLSKLKFSWCPFLRKIKWFCACLVFRHILCGKLFTSLTLSTFCCVWPLCGYIWRKKKLRTMRCFTNYTFNRIYTSHSLTRRFKLARRKFFFSKLLHTRSKMGTTSMILSPASNLISAKP